MKERSITYLRQNLDELLNEIEDTGKPVVITKRGNARCVILDMRSFDHLRSANSFLKMLAKAEDDIDGERHIR